MTGIILIKCRACESEIALSPTSSGEGKELLCSRCKKPVPLRLDSAILEKNMVRNCAACGHDTLYIQKDFNRNLGVAIVAIGSLISLFFFSRGEPLYGMLALFASALVDFVIYSVVGDVTVCYACHAVYRGFDKNPRHTAFDLKDLEKYGGRDPRF